MVGVLRENRHLPVHYMCCRANMISCPDAQGNHRSQATLASVESAETLAHLLHRKRRKTLSPQLTTIELTRLAPWVAYDTKMEVVAPWLLL
jgi:hypothetical protein